jgi:hypothetical protein
MSTTNSSRRRFLGTLGKVLGAGGLLLPWAGRGALALTTDLGKAAQLPVTAAPLPFSADTLRLRDIKRALHALRTNDCRRGLRWRFAAEPPYYGDYSARWILMKTQEYNPVQERLAARPVRSWTDCVELAEAIWTFWTKQDPIAGPTTSKLSANSNHAVIGDHQHRMIVALVEGILALGGGEKFDPTITEDGAS